MKTMTSCMQCQVEFSIPRFSTTEFIEIPDDGVLWTVCDLGHRTAAVLQNEKFALLAEMAVDGIVREHYREAIGSFAASLERLWEYGLKVICRQQGVKPEVFASAWKPMSRQSERQLGAFMAAYLIRTGTRAPELEQKAVELRNQVTHHGYIPNRQDAIRYGQAVADCAYPLLYLLGSEPFEAVIRDVTFDLLRSRGTAAKNVGCRTSSMALATLLEVTRDHAPISVATAVDKRIQYPAFAEAVEFGKLVDPRGSRTMGDD